MKNKKEEIAIRKPRAGRRELARLRTVWQKVVEVARSEVEHKVGAVKKEEGR